MSNVSMCRNVYDYSRIPDLLALLSDPSPHEVPKIMTVDHITGCNTPVYVSDFRDFSCISLLESILLMYRPVVRRGAEYADG